MSIIAREVEFAQGQPARTYHAVGQRDYIAIVARTPGGRIPIVRQYRPAVEAFTWELPAGLSSIAARRRRRRRGQKRRELLEETGYPARSIVLLGTASPCTGRMEQPRPHVLHRDR